MLKIKMPPAVRHTIDGKFHESMIVRMGTHRRAISMVGKSALSYPKNSEAFVPPEQGAALDVPAKAAGGAQSLCFGK